jgi:sugar phosphate permease
MSSTAATAESARNRVAGRRAPQVALIMLNQSFQSLALGGLALFLPLIRSDSHLTFSAAGGLAAASTFTYAFMQIPSGFIADRTDPRKLFIIGLAGTNVLTFLFATLHDYGLMIANQAVSGIFRALVFAPGLLLMAALFAPDRRATAMGLYVAAGFSSSLVLNILGPILVGPLGWRLLFALFAVGGLVTLLIYRRLSSARPAGPNPVHPSWRSMLSLFRDRFMLTVGVIQFVRLSISLGTAAWLPTFLVVERHHTLRMAGLVVALGAALTAPANFLGGYVSDRLNDPARVIGVSLAVLAVTTFLVAEVSDTAALILVIAIQSIFVQVYFGPLFALPVGVLGPDRAGHASGFGNFFANLGGVVFTFGFGAIRDATGSFTLGFRLLSAMAVIGLLCTLSAARTARRATASGG